MKFFQDLLPYTESVKMCIHAKQTCEGYLTKEAGVYWISCDRCSDFLNYTRGYLFGLRNRVAARRAKRRKEI